MQDVSALAERIEASSESEERQDLVLALNALCSAGAKLDLAQTKSLVALLIKFGDADMARVSSNSFGLAGRLSSPSDLVLTKPSTEKKGLS